MKLSMWNLFYELPYEDVLPMISDGSPSITCARWIVTSFLNEDTVYVGNTRDYFDTSQEGAIVVHRHDLFIVHNVEPEELFDEICNIIDRFIDWERTLVALLDDSNGLQKMIDCSRDILKNPSFIYGTDGKNLAIASHYPETVHWHWKELLENQGLSDERMNFLKEHIHLTHVFQDTFPTLRNSVMGDYQYYHCSLFMNGYMTGHFVLFSFTHPFEKGLEYLLEILISWMNLYIEKHFEKFNPMTKVTAAFLAFLHADSEENRQSCLEELSRYVRPLKWQLSDTYQILIVRENVSNEPVLLTKLYLKCMERLEQVLIAKTPNHLILLWNRSRSTSHRTVPEILTSFMDTGFVVGGSHPFSGFFQCHSYYQQACLEAERCLQTHINVSFAGDHLADYWTSMIKKDPLALTYVDRSIFRLYQLDQEEGSSYYETLKVYCMCGYQKTTAARLLSLHRNSMNYRLEKIEEFLGETEFKRLTGGGSMNEQRLQLMSFLILDYGL